MNRSGRGAGACMRLCAVVARLSGCSVALCVCGRRRKEEGKREFKVAVR